MAFEEGLAVVCDIYAATGLLEKAKMNALCVDLQPEKSEMLLKEVHGLQLTPMNSCCPQTGKVAQ